MQEQRDAAQDELAEAKVKLEQLRVELASSVAAGATSAEQAEQSVQDAGMEALAAGARCGLRGRGPAPRCSC